MNNFEWEISGSNAGIYVGSAIVGAIRPAVTESYNDLYDQFPFMHSFVCNVLFETDWWAVIAESRRSGVNVCGFIEGEGLKKIRSLGNRPLDRSFDDVQSVVLGCNSSTKFAYIGEYHNGRANWPKFHDAIFAWLNDTVLREVLDPNSARVARAIPPSPEFDVQTIRAASLVLECEQDIVQGSAFALENVGILTCEHVLGSSTAAFAPDDPTSRYPVRVIKRNAALDIALLEVEGLDIIPLQRGDPDKLDILSPLAIYGFPNYRLGDTGAFMPGNVVGRRAVSTVTRILTNATIVAGSSGGVCVDASSRAVGIAVTGARTLALGSDTENHGVIPIDVLDILLSS